MENRAVFVAINFEGTMLMRANDNIEEQIKAYLHEQGVADWLDIVDYKIKEIDE